MPPSLPLFDQEFGQDVTVAAPTVPDDLPLLSPQQAETKPIPKLILEAPQPSPAKPWQVELPLGFATGNRPHGEPSSEAEAHNRDTLTDALPVGEDAWSFDHGWAMVEPNTAPPSPVDADLPADIDLPDFDAEARQDLWVKPAPDPPLSDFADYPELQAALKAERILRHLWLKTNAERDSYLDWLVTVFLNFPSPRSFEALERLAKAEELDALLLRDMVDLKRIWQRRPEWWVRRAFGSLIAPRSSGEYWNPLVLTGAVSFHQHKNGQWLLSWRAARHICLNAPHGDPVAFVDEMLDRWLQLSPPTRSTSRDPYSDAETYAFISFIEFVRQRAANVIEEQAAARLIDGLRLRSLIEFPI